MQKWAWNEHSPKEQRTPIDLLLITKLRAQKPSSSCVPRSRLTRLVDEAQRRLSSQAGIQHVSQAIAQETEAQDAEHDRQPGEDSCPGGKLHEDAAVA